VRIRLENADGTHVQNAELEVAPGDFLPGVLWTDRLLGDTHVRVFVLVLGQANRIDDDSAVWIYRQVSTVRLSPGHYRDSDFEDPR
jgi:hypothetical protein